MCVCVCVCVCVGVACSWQFEEEIADSGGEIIEIAQTIASLMPAECGHAQFPVYTGECGL